jgi:hypothetical protein
LETYQQVTAIKIFANTNFSGPKKIKQLIIIADNLSQEIFKMNKTMNSEKPTNGI